MAYSRVKLEETCFIFSVNDISYTVRWVENPHKSEYKKKFRVEIIRGGGYRAAYYTDLYINKSNSKDLLLSYFGEISTTAIRDKDVVNDDRKTSKH